MVKNMVITEVDLQITNRCNFNCAFCCVSSSPKVRDAFSLETIEKIVDICSSENVKEIHITGGEPLLFRDIVKVINYIKGKCIKVQLQTNGSLLTNFSSDDLNVDTLFISIDRLQRQGRSHLGLLDLEPTLRKFLEKGVQVRINTVAMRSNLCEIYKLFNEIHKMGIPIFSIFCFSPFGRGSLLKNELLAPQEWIKFRKEFVKYVYDKEYYKTTCIYFQPAFLEFDEVDCLISKVQCRARDDNFVMIKYNGDLLPCSFFYHSNFYFGNILKDGLRMRYDREKIFSTEVSDCQFCTFYSKCLGGCQGYNHIFGYKIPMRDIRCINSTGLIPVCPEKKVDIVSLLEV